VVVAETALDPDPMMSFSDVLAYVEAVAQTAVVGGVVVPVVAVAVATAAATAAAPAVLHSSRLSCHRPADQTKASLW
jgi:hypothetical protein